MNALRNPARRRQGWSYIQVMLYLVAVSAGVWLGAYYIGVPVEEIAYTALDKSTLLEKIPPEHRPETPAGLVQDPEKLRERNEKIAAELKSELAELQREIGELKTPTGASESKATSDVANSNVAKRTLEYWNELRKITTQVGKLNAEADAVNDPVSAIRILEVRGKSFRYGAKAIDALNAADVDPQAYELGQTLAAWYGSGANFFEQTLAAWEGNRHNLPAQEESLALTTLQQQFEKESTLLQTKAPLTAQSLTSRFGVEFKPLP